MDYTLVDKKHIHCSRDAEANDMIHMCSDHRSVMAQFFIAAPQKKVLRQDEDEKRKRIQRAKVTTKRDLVKQLSSKNAMPNSKEKLSTKPKLQPPHRNRK